MELVEAQRTHKDGELTGNQLALMEEKRSSQCSIRIRTNRFETINRWRITKAIVSQLSRKCLFS